jgi:D-xylose transport system substrate-binding protein
MALSVAACGKAGSHSDNKGTKIGLLLPENKTTRYEQFDRPLITQKIHALCSDCTVDYKNAAGDAATQKQQFDAAITNGDKVIILDAVNAGVTKSWVSEASKKGVSVVAYDRLAEGAIKAYVSYDNSKVGALQGQALLDALGSKASNAKVVMINGSPTDPNAALFKKGAHSVLDGKVKIVYEQDIDGWNPDTANQKMTAAITKLGKHGFDAVYSANDGMAAGIASALKSAGISGIPLTGQDAQVDGIQRILAGQQTFTIYKAIKPEADTTAEIAVDLLKGKAYKSLATGTSNSNSAQNIPTKLFNPVVVNKDNVKSTVIADKFLTVQQICTTAYADACKKAGLE